MAGKTEYVNYQGFGKHIDQMKALGDFIQGNIDMAYKSLGAISTATGWKGPQYDKLVKSFNDMKDGFDTILSDIGYRIPNMMNSAADAWAKVDGGIFSNRNVEEVTRIVAVKPSNEAALTWNKEAVDATKKDIEDYLDKAAGGIKELAQRFKAMNTDWQGDDYDNNLADIQKYQNEVAKDVDQLKNDFVKYMNESIDAYDKVRKAISEWK